MVLASLAEEREGPPASLRPLPPCAAAPGASGAATGVRGELLLLLVLLLFRLARFFLRAEREGDAAIFVTALWYGKKPFDAHLRLPSQNKLR